MEICEAMAKTGDKLLDLMDAVAKEDRLRIAVQYGLSFDEAQKLFPKVPEMLKVLNSTMNNVMQKDITGKVEEEE